MSTIEMKIAKELVDERRADVRHAHTNDERKAARKRLEDAKRYLYEVTCRTPGYEATAVTLNKG